MDICDDMLPHALLAGDDDMIDDIDQHFMDLDHHGATALLSSDLYNDDGYMSPPYDDEHPPGSVHSTSSSQPAPLGAGSIKSEPLSGCYSSDESSSGDAKDDFGYQTIDPDEFLVKTEVKFELPARQTPSPAGSQGSNADAASQSSSSSSSGHSSDYQWQQPQASPSSLNVLSTTANVQQSPPIQFTALPAVTVLPQSIQFGQAIPLPTGTLIPITPAQQQPIATVPTAASTVKRIRIQPKPAVVAAVQSAVQPKPSATINGATTTTAPAPKRIVLSQQDYSALMQRCRSQPGTSVAVQPVTIKATPAPIVKPAPQQPAPIIIPAPAPPSAMQPQQQQLFNGSRRLLMAASANAVAAPTSTTTVNLQSIQPQVIGIPAYTQVLRLAAAPQQQPMQQQFVAMPVSQSLQQQQQPHVIRPAPIAVVSSAAPLAFIKTAPVYAAAPAPAACPAPLPSTTCAPVTTAHLPRVAPKTTATTSTTSTARLDIEDKQQKKHQRMIKNRESACLSRKKKKDHLTALEDQIARLGDENRELRTQNGGLRERLQQLERLACACGRTLGGGPVAAATATATTTATTTSRVRLLPAGMQLQRNKKNAVFLLAVVFMVSLQFGPFDNLLGASSLERSFQPPTGVVNHQSTRHLLWVDDEVAAATHRNASPPHDVQPIANGSLAILPTFRTHPNGRAATAEPPAAAAAAAYPMCPLYVNQTENVRLASELRRWIGDLSHYLSSNAGGAGSYNGTVDASVDVGAGGGSDLDPNTISNYLLNDNTIRSLFRQLHHTDAAASAAQIKKELAVSASYRSSVRPPTANDETDDVPSAADVGAVGHPKHYRAPPPTANDTAADHRRLQLYDPVGRDALQYAELIEQLRRQDDTFYVVSFSGDHLLLPALAHNKTYRPKMSLMLPSVGVNSSYGAAEFVTLMQIDCEVVNTSLIQIKERLIPRHMRSKAAAATTATTTKKTKTAARAKRQTVVATSADAKQAPAVPVLPLISKPAHPAQGDFNVSDEALAGNSTTDYFEVGYNLTKAAAYKPYFVDDEAAARGP